MDTQLQLLIEMKDRLSKPLTDQQKALKGVNQQIKDLIKAQKLEEQAQAKAIKDQAKAKKSAEEWSKAVGSEMVAAVEVGAAAVAALAVGVGVLTLGLVGAIAKTIEFTSAQAAMGEKLAASYTLFTRDAEQAGKTRDMIDDLAARMHLAPDKLHDTAHELLAAGIKPQLELQRSVAAITALQKTGNDDAAGKLKGLLTRGAQSRRQFGGHGFVGISRTEATEALGVGGFEQLQQAIARRGGKALQTGYNSLMTTADVANKALADVITGGKVGDAARKMVGGLPEVFARLSAEIRRFFQGLSQGDGFRKFIESLHGVIDVLEAFGKQGGAKSTVGFLDSGFKLLAKGIDRGTILLIDMVAWFYNLAAAAIETYNSFKKWLEQGNRLEFLKGALLGIAVVFGIILLVVAAVALALGAVVAFMLILPLTLAAAFAGFVALFAYIYSISDQFKSLFSKDAWKNFGADAINGLIDGLTKGIKLVNSAAKAVGDAVKSGVKGALDAHSPSREMMKIGAMARDGFQMGLDNGQSFSIGAIKPSLGVGGGGVSSITWNGDVIIQGGGGATADELKPMIDSAFADAFERLQLELGERLMVDLLSTAVSPWAQPLAWDTIQIGKLFWYGKFEIRGASRKYLWNISNGWGFMGAFETFQAAPPSKFTVTFYVWADEQYSTYLQLVDILRYSPSHLPPNNFASAGGNINALTMVHPQLQNNGITQCVVESIGDLQKQSDDLMFSFAVDFVEFVPQRAFPPQSPDTAAEQMDPLLSPEKKDALAKLAVARQRLDNAVANTGKPGALP